MVAANRVALIHANRHELLGYVTVARFAELTGYGQRTINRLIHAGLIPAIRLSPKGAFRIPLDAALAAVAKNSGKEVAS